MNGVLSREKTNSPKLVGKLGMSILAISALANNGSVSSHVSNISNTASSSFSKNSTYDSSLYNHIPYVEVMLYEEQTITPQLSNIQSNVNKYDEIFSIFPSVRDFTEEEIKDYNKSLDTLFIPLGINVFDL